MSSIGASRPGLGVDGLFASYLARMALDGYCVIPDALARAEVEALNRDLDERFMATPFCKGVFYGETTKRFGSLLKRSAHAECFVRQPFVLRLVEQVLGPYCDRIQLNLTQAIEIHPDAPQQLPHRDQDMWGGPKGKIEYLVNVMWPLTPFTKENGATVLWPGSHLNQSAMTLPPELSVPMEIAPGSALLFLGSTLHAGGANRTRVPRRGLIVSYCLGWLKPFEAQTLIYPPEIARAFSPELAALIGYAIHRPNLNNYEGQCPSILLKGGPPDVIQARDAFTSAQAAYIAQMIENSTSSQKHMRDGGDCDRILEEAK